MYKLIIEILHTCWKIIVEKSNFAEDSCHDLLKYTVKLRNYMEKLGE